MSDTKAINANANTLYKLQDNATSFVSNAFPLRRFVKSTLDHEQAWIAAYKTETKKYFEAVLTNQKLDEIEREQAERQKNSVPKRRILKTLNFTENKQATSLNLLDGFYLMQLCCVEDPMNLCSVDISAKSLKNIKEDDMGMFENITDINANENNLNFESFRTFQNLKNLSLACNNIKTIRLKNDEFKSLETLDLSYNNLNPNDIAHLGVLTNLKSLKLTGNNLTYLPDTLTKLYVKSKDNKKIVTQKFPNLEELYLDHNKLKEENSFDVLAVLKKLRVLYINSNCLTCVPSLKIFRNNHVEQEFSKSYHKRRSIKLINSSNSQSRKSSIDSGKLNESMVKDLALERSNSEMNMHSSNVLRNSFIIEEEEEETSAHLENVNPKRDESPSRNNNNNNNNKNNESDKDNVEKGFELPFSELIYINLADNQIQEEDDLISLVSWPMLNEIIIYGNPIVYNNVGHPPLLKQYLVDRLGINLQRQRPLKALKTPLLIPQRESRLVETTVPKIPKMPFEMRMLTYYNDTDAESSSRRSQLSSNSASSNFEESFVSQNNYKKSFSSSDCRNHVYKPFKSTKERDQDNKMSDSYEDDETEYYNSQTNQTSDKAFNSFFMTQVDQEEAIQQLNNKRQTQLVEKPKHSTNNKKQIIDTYNRFENYEILMNIENENEIKVPKDVNGSVRALKQMLNNPMIYREPCKELDKKQNAYRTLAKEPLKQQTTGKHLQPKLTQMNDIIDDVRDRKNTTETSLIDAINSKDEREVEVSKRLFDKAQNKYIQVKKDSLKSLYGGKKSTVQMEIIMEKIKLDNEADDTN